MKWSKSISIGIFFLTIAMELGGNPLIAEGYLIINHNLELTLTLEHMK